MAMRYIWLILGVLPLSALGQDVIPVLVATMDVTEFGTPDECVLYVNGVEAGRGECGVPVQFPGVITEDGVYDFQYSLVKGTYETALSEITVAETPFLPADPTDGPGISMICLDSTGTEVTCPSQIQIVVTP